ncbi:MAG: hypothetical protein IPI49_20125 [Myxococcales bacterium]|nr:hypothetical protein [Myxococcales bacterium]
MTALAGDCELAMFEVMSLEGDLLCVWTRFTLAVGEELPLQVESIGRTIGRVVGHQTLDGGRVVTQLRLLSGAPTSAPAADQG